MGKYIQQFFTVWTLGPKTGVTRSCSWPRVKAVKCPAGQHKRGPLGPQFCSWRALRHPREKPSLVLPFPSLLPFPSSLPSSITFFTLLPCCKSTGLIKSQHWWPEAVLGLFCASTVNSCKEQIIQGTL